MQLFHSQQLAPLCKQNKIKYLGVFGSYARGEDTLQSDVDLLVDFEHTKSFFELAHIQSEFEKIFEKKIDLVLRSSVKRSIKPYIQKDIITIYEK